jgi:hypothetical protein
MLLKERYMMFHLIELDKWKTRDFKAIESFIKAFVASIKKIKILSMNYFKIRSYYFMKGNGIPIPCGGCSIEGFHILHEQPTKMENCTNKYRT